MVLYIWKVIVNRVLYRVDQKNIHISDLIFKLPNDMKTLLELEYLDKGTLKCKASH